MRFSALLFLLGAGIGSGAGAQVYTGVSAGGSVVLSSQADETADTLLIEAEKLSPALRTAELANEAAVNTIPANYLQFVEAASQTTRVPSELIHAVIKVESNYNPRALSRKGAQGLMQLMPTTAKRFGNANSWDPKQNILTGAKYLRWLLDYFDQDVELAVAAYNAGESAVVRSGRQIPQYAETVRYVPRVMSIYKASKPKPNLL
jgi:soluble lytic murein transglycosylase-like protein